jgi:hypothetical protein
MRDPGAETTRAERTLLSGRELDGVLTAQLIVAWVVRRAKTRD